jgi:hypothetical protein
MAGGTRGPTRTRSVHPAHLLDVHAFQLCWCGDGLGAGAFTWVHGRLAVGVGTAPGPA